MQLFLGLTYLHALYCRTQNIMFFKKLKRQNWYVNIQRELFTWSVGSLKSEVRGQESTLVFFTYFVPCFTIWYFWHNFGLRFVTLWRNPFRLLDKGFVHILVSTSRSKIKVIEKAVHS